MFCTNCGTKNESATAFCVGCGQAMSAAQAPAPPPQVEIQQPQAPAEAVQPQIQQPQPQPEQTQSFQEVTKEATQAAAQKASELAGKATAFVEGKGFVLEELLCIGLSFIILLLFFFAPFATRTISESFMGVRVTARVSATGAQAMTGRVTVFMKASGMGSERESGSAKDMFGKSSVLAFVHVLNLLIPLGIGALGAKLLMTKKEELENKKKFTKFALLGGLAGAGALIFTGLLYTFLSPWGLDALGSDFFKEGPTAGGGAVISLLLYGVIAGAAFLRLKKLKSQV